MSEEKDSWGDYSKLVLKELERLNDNHEKMRSDFDGKLNEMNLKLNDVKGIEKLQKVNKYSTKLRLNFFGIPCIWTLNPLVLIFPLYIQVRVVL